MLIRITKCSKKLNKLEQIRMSKDEKEK